MKPSRFNLYLEHLHGVALFNTLSGKAGIFSDSAADCIRRGSMRGLGLTQLRQAMAIGALVSEPTDEHEAYRSYYRSMSADTRRLALVVALTYACNLRCPYCFEDGLHRHSGRITGHRLELLLSAIGRRCRSQGTAALSLMLFGGEPLLLTDECAYLLKELSTYCDARGIAFTGSMSSNGTLLDSRRIEQLAPYLNTVQITFDGPRDLHDAIRIPANGSSTYDEVIQAIHLLRGNDVAVQIRIQVGAENKGRLPELVRDLKREGFLNDPAIRCEVALLRRFSRWRCNFSAAPVDLGNELERELLGMAPELLKQPTPVVQILPCIVSGNVLCIDPDLDLYKCITQLGQKEFSVGRIDEEGEFVLAPAYNDFMARDPLTFKECADCAYLPLCGGGCPVAAYQESGSWHHPACHQKEVLRSRVGNAMEGLG